LLTFGRFEGRTIQVDSADSSNRLPRTGEGQNGPSEIIPSLRTRSPIAAAAGNRGHGEELTTVPLDAAVAGHDTSAATSAESGGYIAPQSAAKGTQCWKGKASDFYYMCCNCGHGPMVVEINQYCALCAVRICSGCKIHQFQSPD
jgi:hypothetical protein